MTGPGSAAARALGAALAVAAAFAAAPAQAAGIAVANGWVRPTPAQAPAVPVYLDVTSDGAVTLIGATSPVATSVAIMTVEDGDAPAGKTVRELALKAGTTARFAPRGNFLELRELREAIPAGKPVPLTLEFRDAAGRKETVAVELVVRGFLMRQSSERLPMPVDGMAAPTSAAEAAAQAAQAQSAAPPAAPAQAMPPTAPAPADPPPKM